MNYRNKIYEKYATNFQSSGYQRADVIRNWVISYRWFLRNWLPLNKEDAILDVGCGGAQMLQALRVLGYRRIQGVDVSSQQVERAREAGFKVECMDAVDYLASKRAAWGTIIAIDLIEHLTKDEALRFLEVAYHALTPGSRLILQMPNPASKGGMQVRYGDLTHEIALTPDCAVRLLKLYGFVEIEARETGPIPRWNRPVNCIRWLAWQLFRLSRITFDIIETGGCTNRVLTRVYLVSAQRPKEGGSI